MFAMCVSEGGGGCLERGVWQVWSAFCRRPFFSLSNTIVDFDLSGPQVSDKKGSHHGSTLKRRPALDRSRQRPVSLRSRTELVPSMPSDEDDQPLLGSGDDEPAQGTRPSKCTSRC